MNEVDLKRLVERVSAARRALYPKSEALAGAYEKIGSTLSSDMKVLAAKQKIYDQGGLVNNTTYAVMPDGVEIGTFGVKYAKYHEYGTKPSHKMWLYLISNIIGKGTVKKKPKGVIQTSGTGRDRMAWIKARPYVRPTMKSEKNQEFIIRTLREALIKA
jgi:hypothetical protein